MVSGRCVYRRRVQRNAVSDFGQGVRGDMLRNVHGSYNLEKQENTLFLWTTEEEHITAIRNIVKIFGYHERDNTTQKSIGKAKFTSAEECAPNKVWEASTLGEKSTLVLSLIPLAWIWQVLGLQSMQLANWKGDRLEKGPLETKKFKSSGKQ
jgi:hypothetical protein